MIRRLSWLILGILLVSMLVACGDDSDDNSASESEPPTSTATETSTVTGDEGMSGMDMEMGDEQVDSDLKFIDAMTVHHQSAVEMSEIALDEAEHPELVELAEEIIAAQKQEIVQFQEWRDAWYPDAPESDLSGMQDMAGMAMDHGDMEMLTNAERFDLMFIEMMIPHHQSAIEMAESILETTERPELQQMAQDIIEAQQAEIEQMKQWQQEWSAE